MASQKTIHTIEEYLSDSVLLPYLDQFLLHFGFLDGVLFRGHARLEFLSLLLKSEAVFFPFPNDGCDNSGYLLVVPVGDWLGGVLVVYF